MPDLVKIQRALISVSDKTGIEAFARGLVAQGAEIISTGGTAGLLTDAGIPVTPIDKVTGFPEMMDGRVKTLHPAIHGGLLAVRDNPAHAAAMKEHGIRAIDLVCISLYPFEKTISRAGAPREEAVEQIDIGGPSMIRSGAKNHEYVTVVTNPGQYGPVLAEMEVTQGCTSLQLRRELAGAAFERTASYDRAIADYLRSGQSGAEHAEGAESGVFPPVLQPSLRLLSRLRYGENPHQEGAVYLDPTASGPSVLTAAQLHGKELSYNNLADASAALDLAIGLKGHRLREHGVAAAVIKHANPCGAAIAPTALEAVDRAIAGDPLAAFGGIMAVAGLLDGGAAERLCGKDIFLEVLVVEAIESPALEALRKRWQNLRILKTGVISGSVDRRVILKFIRGGALAQTPDSLAHDPAGWQHKAGPAPDPTRLADAAALEVIVGAMASNAVAIGGRDGASVRLLGGGLGQVDRVTACRIAVEKAGPAARGAIAVSDAFFPFSDGPRMLMEAGVTMIVHPGGSKRDQETFDLCNAGRVTCMVTGTRRFRH